MLPPPTLQLPPPTPFLLQHLPQKDHIQQPPWTAASSLPTPLRYVTKWRLHKYIWFSYNFRECSVTSRCKLQFSRFLPSLALCAFQTLRSWSYSICCNTAAWLSFPFHSHIVSPRPLLAKIRRVCDSIVPFDRPSVRPSVCHSQLIKPVKLPWNANYVRKTTPRVKRVRLSRKDYLASDMKLVLWHFLDKHILM